MTLDYTHPVFGEGLMTESEERGTLKNGLIFIYETILGDLQEHSEDVVIDGKRFRRALREYLGQLDNIGKMYRDEIDGKR